MNRMHRLPKHLVLDLDETVVHTEDDMERYYELGIPTNPNLAHIRQNTFVMRLVDVVGARGAGETEMWWVSKRPQLDLFLHYAFQTFQTVSVWTAAKQRYAEAIVGEIFKDHPRPYVLWHWEMCKYDDNGNLTKPLKDLADYMKVPLSDMCILDDNMSTFSANKENAIWMPRWDPKPTIRDLGRPDDVFIKLIRMWDAMSVADHINAHNIRATIVSREYVTTQEIVVS